MMLKQKGSNFFYQFTKVKLQQMAAAEHLLKLFLI